MNKIGVHYAFWGDQWNVDMCERVRLASAVGFDNLEVTPPDYMVNLDYKKMTELKKCAEDHNIDMSFCIGFPKSKDMAGEDAKVRQAGIDYSKRMIEAVHFMGGKILSGILYSYWPCLYTEPITPEYKSDCWKRAVESVQEVIPLAEKYDIIYAVEMVNRFEQFIVNSVKEGKQFIKDVGSPNGKLLLDVHHANIEENSIAGAIREAGSLLAHVHLSENNRRLPGTGDHIQWPEVAKALKDIDFKGRVVIESFLSAGGPVGNDLRIWRDLDSDLSLENQNKLLRDSLAFVKNLLQ